MAWDIEGTRAKILDAAISEFSLHGFAGARIAEISRLSGCNRERIYWYYGCKAELFEAAVTSRLDSALEDLPIAGEGPEAIGDFAGRFFDASVSHPGLSRLTTWEGLEGSEPVALERRSARSAATVAEFRRAVPTLTQTEAEDLLLTIVTLCHAWVTSTNIGQIVTDAGDDARRRAAIVRTAELLAGSVMPHDR